LPLVILPTLRVCRPQINFIVVDPNENFPPENEKDLIILDAVKGISSTALLDFSDLAQVEKSPVSPHDYDLLLHLLLLKKMGKVNKVTIIGIPQDSIDKKAEVIDRVLAFIDGLS